MRTLRKRRAARLRQNLALSCVFVLPLVIGAPAYADQGANAELAQVEAHLDSFKDCLAPMALNRGDNLAYTKPALTVHPEQTAWARQMGRGIYMPVPDKVYVAVGYGITSMTMVVGDDGVIVIDSGETDDFAAEVMKDFRTITAKPIKAVVYTHRHPDHPFGTKGLGISPDDVGVEDDKVHIYAHDAFQEYLVNDASVVAPILSIRTALASTFLPVGPKGRVHQALGPTFDSGDVSLIMPSHTFTGALDVTEAGVKMHLFGAYGDAEDEISIWFPELKHLHGSETIQGETFPNMYTLRGTKYRDPVEWYQGVDKLLEFAPDAESYSGSHMRPWICKDFIVERITNYRDAIQYVHDQSVRLMNKGYTREELAESVKLPPQLQNDPWLGQYYGTVAHSTRNVYGGYLGWYEGDPTALATPGYRQKAAFYVDAMGGRESILAEARKAIEAKNYGWAMEILTHPIRLDHNDMEARELKAEAMREWAYLQPNIYWRGLALGGALELEAAIDYSLIWNFASPDIVAALPALAIVESMRVQLDPQKARDAHITVGFSFTDEETDSALEVRNGVAVFHNQMPEQVDAEIEMTKATLDEIILGELTPQEALDSGLIVVDGDMNAVATFLSFFDFPDDKSPIQLVVR